MTLRFFEFDGFYQIKCILRPKNQKNLTNIQYFPKFKGSTLSIVDALSSMNINNSFAYRTKIAEANGFKKYSGKASENLKMIKLLKNGKLIKP